MEKLHQWGWNWFFPSSAIGRHYYTGPAQQDDIRPAGCCLVKCARCGAEAGVWCQQDSPTPNGNAARSGLDHDERVRKRLDDGQA